jgi:DNA-directed RNA polymerase specialized sigma24 family protein
MAKKAKKKIKKSKKVQMNDTPLVKKEKKKSVHYVDNNKLLTEMVQYVDAMKKHTDDPSKVDRPRVSEYIGETILKIAERLATKPNFVRYTYREEMISDGIENCLTYLDNFDPAKSSNPFAYLTQIIYYAFLRRIGREKKQAYIKMNLFQNMDKYGKVHQYIPNDLPYEVKTTDPYAELFHLTDLDVKNFKEETASSKSSKKKKKSKKAGLDTFFTEE